MTMYSFVPPFREAKFCGVPSCVFDKLGCAAGGKSLRNIGLNHTCLFFTARVHVAHSAVFRLCLTCTSTGVALDISLAAIQLGFAARQRAFYSSVIIRKSPQMFYPPRTASSDGAIYNPVEAPANRSTQQSGRDVFSLRRSVTIS
jgi:hypothetical protein